MADVQKIFILHTTADEKDAESDAEFQLIIEKPTLDLTMDFPTFDHDERERGRTDEYVFDVSGEGVTTESKIRIKMTTTEDGWLPKTMWAIGQTREGTFELLAAHSEWAEGWFDRGDDAAGPDSHPIN
jgi:hypothetical protein